MIQLQIPFLLTDLSQFPSDLLLYDINFEGSVFDGDYLARDSNWNLIKSHLSSINRTYGKVIKSLHFPMDNANYLEDSNSRDKLFKYIELAKKFEIDTIVLHSNYILPVSKFDLRLLKKIRSKYIDFFHQLNEYLKGDSVRIGVENMPIIGDKGEDFDSIFVLPSDFDDINFSHVGITWDFGHWAYTHHVLSFLRNFSSAVKVDKVSFSDYVQLKDRIIQTHFSSFLGTTYPDANSQCREGVHPENGTPAIRFMKDALIEVDSWKKTVPMTLEIKENDYRDRVNARSVIEWVQSVISAV